MKQRYIIVTDAATDMTSGVMAENDIRMLPMNYSLGESEKVRDHIETADELKEFFDSQRGGDLTRTTQITPQIYADYFTELAKECGGILCITLSGGLSGTYNSSLLAAEDVMAENHGVKIRCVDSRAATAGQGLVTELAAINRANGMSLDENADWLEANRLKVQHWFMVDDLMYLKRGGRIPASAALLGTALNIKPILTIEADGRLGTIAKKRGDKAAMAYIIEEYKKASNRSDGEIVYVLDTDNEPAALQLVNAVREFNPKADVRRSVLSPIIAAHIGPGFCAVVHFSDSFCARTEESE